MPFDLLQALQGRGYPEDSVTVYFDESAAVQIRDLRKKITAVDLSTEDLEKLNDDLTDAADKAKKSAYTFHARGRARQVYQDANKIAKKQFPIERDYLQQIVPNEDRDELLLKLVWAAMITKIVDPAGDEIVEPTSDQIDQIFKFAPDQAVSEVNAMLAGLRQVGTEFEFVKQSSDFS